MVHSSTRLFTAIFGVLCVFLPPTFGAEPADVATSIRQLMQDREYAKAEQAIDLAASKKDAPVDYLLYLKGRAAHLAKDYDRAIAIYDAALKGHADSSWARRIRFAKGAALARKGDFRAAEAIYEAEAIFLLSTQRKAELADVFLEFAQAAFKPAKKNVEPDYAKALKFYEQALVVGTTEDKQQSIEQKIAECYQRQNDFAEAAKRYQKFLTNHDASKLAIEVRYQLGHCHLAQNQRVEARRVWEDMLAAHPDDPSPQIAQAMFHLAHTYGPPEKCDDEVLGLAVAALDRFLKSYPAHDLAAAAHLEIAERFVQTNHLGDATERLTAFLADPRYAERKEIPAARFRLGETLQMQSKDKEALAVWREFLAAHPTDRRWSDAQLEIVSTEYQMAEQAREDENYDEAKKLYAAFLARYPLDERAPDILLALGQMHFAQEQWEAAKADWRRLESKYPETDAAIQGLLLIGITLEEKQGKYAEAIEVYEKLANEYGAPQAHERLAELTTESYQIASRRTYRTDEPPRVELTSRNLERVSVRVYSVDLQTYFRKMHLARGVESLDIRLIDPDKTFEFEVPDYAKYKQSITSIPLPLLNDAGEGGVLAVTVSTATHEATTMVVRSDLDILVKSSRDELFVFAQNMRTGKPWPGAKLLVSDGRQVFAEVETGEDGVLQQSFDQLKTAGDVRVFATSNGSIASDVKGLKGLKVARGLTDKGYIYTERPAYRAGQLVHARGIIRQVAGDTYQVEKDAEYQLSVIDPRSRTIWEESVKLNQFGSFFTRFALPPASPQGDYRIVVANAAKKKQYQGTFIVHEYNLPNVYLTIDTPKHVYYRGEEITGTITAKYYHGAPVAERELEYQLGNDRVIHAKTDKQGIVKFTFPTRELREEQTLNLVARMPEFNVATAAPLKLALRGFSIAMSTMRPAFLAGESFEVSLTTSDAEGKPTAQQLELEVIEKNPKTGQTVSQRAIESHEVATDAKTGIGRVTLQLDKGAHYLLVAQGVDQFGTTITGSHLVQVSGDEDTVRLRILADQHTYRSGDTAEVNVHWREAAALALITHQGARVLDYQLVTLKKGDNRLKIPMTTKLAPNFELAIAVMTDRKALNDAGLEQSGRLHQASSPFTVEKNLLVDLKIKRKKNAQGEPLPGEEIDGNRSARNTCGGGIELGDDRTSLARPLWRSHQADRRIFPRAHSPTSSRHQQQRRFRLSTHDAANQ